MPNMSHILSIKAEVRDPVTVVAGEACPSLLTTPPGSTATVTALVCDF
jgi:hypothetical protein